VRRKVGAGSCEVGAGAGSWEVEVKLELEPELELVAEAEAKVEIELEVEVRSVPPAGGPRSRQSPPREPPKCAALPAPRARAGWLAVSPQQHSRAATAGTPRGWLHRHLPPPCGYLKRRIVSHPSSAQPLLWP